MVQVPDTRVTLSYKKALKSLFSNSYSLSLLGESVTLV